MFFNQDKKPERTAAFTYVIIVVIIMLLINAFILPAIVRRNIRDVDYSTFLNMVGNKEISTAQSR